MCWLWVNKDDDDDDDTATFIDKGYWLPIQQPGLGSHIGWVKLNLKPSASEVTTVWPYRNSIIIIIDSRIDSGAGGDLEQSAWWGKIRRSVLRTLKADIFNILLINLIVFGTSVS